MMAGKPVITLVEHDLRGEEGITVFFAGGMTISVQPRDGYVVDLQVNYSDEQEDRIAPPRVTITDTAVNVTRSLDEIAGVTS